MRVWDENVDADALRVRQGADRLYKRAYWFVVTAMAGLGTASSVIFWLWRDWKLGYNVHPAAWEPVLVFILGSITALGLAMPFSYWFRIQAGLVLVQLRVEENTRKATETAAMTHHSIQALADAGMSGEWRLAGPNDTTAQLNPVDEVPE